MELRKNYICRRPYEFSEIYDKTQFICCPSWLPEDVKETGNANKDFHSDLSNKIRNSIEDGSYSYCDSIKCPYLNGLDNGVVSEAVFLEKNSRQAKQLIDNPEMSIVNLAFDMSCNLACPSCRSTFINYKGENRSMVDMKLDSFINQAGNSVRTLILCGSADPFFSKTYLNFMINFDKSKFPKLKQIHLHTNANLWTEKVWNKITNVHKYVKSFEISIDAATKHTYESKVRIGGDWDLLMKNLEFITGIETIKRKRFSFVVQKDNYKEMRAFYDLINSKYRGDRTKLEICYIGITDWGSYENEQEFKQQEIHNPTHPLYEDFKIELEKIAHLNVDQNFYHIISKPTTLI